MADTVKVPPEFEPLFSRAQDLVSQYFESFTRDLRESEERYRDLYENAPNAYFSVGADGLIRGCNKRALRMLGYEKEGLAGRRVLDLYADSPSGKAKATQVFERFPKGESVPAEELQMRRKDGTALWVNLSVSPVRDREGRIVESRSVAVDITEQKKAEAALEASRTQLAASQKMEAVGRLAGGVAHDFNNILTAVLAYSDFLAKSLEPEDPRQQDVSEIRSAASRASSLTRQLLAFGRKQVFEVRVMNLNTVVADMERMLRRTIGEDVRLKASLLPDLRLVKADPSQLGQVLLNLVINSRDAMPDGGDILVETSNLELPEPVFFEDFILPPGRYVVLAVSDTGCGVPKEALPHIFEPFFSTKERGKGTGLGLSMVYGIVKQSGGYISVRTESGKGASFKVYLPCVEDSAAAPEKEAPGIESLAGSETVLVVEDEDAVRSVAVRALSRCGYKVLEARGGEEALRTAREWGSPIHLVLTDVVMPRMDGPSLIKRLLESRPSLKVVYMSGYTDELIARKGVLEPGTVYLPKPFTPYSVALKVKEALGGK